MSILPTLRPSQFPTRRSTCSHMPVLERELQKRELPKRAPAKRTEVAPRPRLRGEWIVSSAVHSAQGPRPTMEDKHTVADDGWITGGPSQPRRVLSSNSWPRCAFYGCFDGHGGSRAATCASRMLWKQLQSALIKRCRELSMPPPDGAPTGAPATGLQSGGGGTDQQSGGGEMEDTAGREFSEESGCDGSSSHGGSGSGCGGDEGGSDVSGGDVDGGTDGGQPRGPCLPCASPAFDILSVQASLSCPSTSHSAVSEAPCSTDRLHSLAPTAVELQASELQALVFEAFALTEADVLAQSRRGRWEDGCTAVTCLLFGPHLIIGNLGDSRAVLCTTAGKAVRARRAPSRNSAILRCMRGERGTEQMGAVGSTLQQCAPGHVCP